MKRHRQFIYDAYVREESSTPFSFLDFFVCACVPFLLSGYPLLLAGSLDLLVFKGSGMFNQESGGLYYFGC